MKLKYYLRGLGIGIAVTALVIGTSGKQSTGEMTDEQIKARATELGMVEDTLLSDVLQDSAEERSQVEEITSEQMSSDESTTEESGSEEAVTEESITEEPAIEEPTTEESVIKEPTTEESTIKGPAIKEPEIEESVNEKNSSESTVNEKVSAEEIEIFVNSGESSVSISKKLAIAGLVDNAAKYDAYLCKNGYDKRICTGSHMIKKGATEEEIAKIITSK